MDIEPVQPKRKRGPKYYAGRRARIVKSPYNFLSELVRCIRAKRRFEVSIDKDIAHKLWDTQCGRCAITNLPMLYERRNPRSVSIDRIDSNLGYSPDNIQLVCRFINLAKQQYSNEVMKNLFDDYVKLQSSINSAISSNIVHSVIKQNSTLISKALIFERRRKKRVV